MQHVTVRCIKVIIEGICLVKNVSAAEVVKDSAFSDILKQPDSDWADWNTFAGWLQQVDNSQLAPIDWVKVGAASFSSKNLKIATSLINTTLSVRLAYWIAAKWFGPSQFRVIKCLFEDLGPLVIRETLEIPPQLDPCPQVFKIFEGSLTVMPEFLFQLPGSRVDAVFEPRKAIYTIQFPKKNSLGLRFISGIRNLTQKKMLFTELSNAQTALSEQTNTLVQERSEFKNLFANFPDGIIIFRDNKILFTNEKMALSLGQTNPKNLMNQSLLPFISSLSTDLRAYVTDEKKTTDRLPKSSLEVVFLTKDGQNKFESECTWMPITFDGVSATVLIARDITERKQDQNRAIAADRLKSMGLLAAGVGHEINNPLCFVMMKMELLEDKLLQYKLDGLSTDLSEISDGLKRIQTIVQDLKLLSREDMVEKLLPTDVNEAIRSALSLANHQVKHRAQLELHLGEVPQIAGNQAQLSQVLLNLVLNSVQAIPPNRVAENKIIIETTHQSSQVQIVVADTGCGIEDKFKKIVFKPFFTTKSPGEGTGLGLSICHSIIERFGGSIRFTSEVEQGTRFTITLPALKEKKQEIKTAARKTTMPLLSRGRVLVIDDDTTLLETIAEIIDSQHDAQAVSNVEEALQLITSGNQYDVILCDLMMPDIDGMEFYRRLQQISSELCHRVVFLTGGSFTERTDDFLRQPHIRHFQKPILSKELFTVLNSIILKN